MSLFKDFMSLGIQAEYKCGAKATQNTNVLAKASKKPKNVDTSKARMERLKKMVSESKTGQQTLDFLDEKGSEMKFEKMPYYGYFEPESNIIALNPAMSDEDLAVTLVHEARHAWQDSQMEFWKPEVTPKAFLMAGFAIEADACATEVLYAHEMRETNPKIWEAHQKSSYAPMSTEFEKNFKETGDTAQARAAALMTWHDIEKIQTSYADTYVDYLADVGRREMGRGKKTNTTFTQDIPASLVVEKFFKDYDGNAFMTDGSAMETPEKLQLSEKQATKMVKGIEPYMTRNNKGAAQYGLDKVSVKMPNGDRKTCVDVLKKVRSGKNKSKANNKGRNSGR